MAGPLGGMTVIEIADMVSGPHAGKLFAAMGADVVKVEPLRGDPARRQPPFPRDVPHREERLVPLPQHGEAECDPRRGDGGGGVLRRLVSTADVVVENHPPGWMAARGFGYEDLRRSTPGSSTCR